LLRYGPGQAVPPLLQKVRTPSSTQLGSYPVAKDVDEVALAVPPAVVESALL
jgi:hypothetical protein